jgi:hypothetical protein
MRQGLEAPAPYEFRLWQSAPSRARVCAAKTNCLKNKPKKSKITVLNMCGVALDLKDGAAAGYAMGENFEVLMTPDDTVQRLGRIKLMTHYPGTNA